ncbi:phage integrase SAM-like domain-containing protein [Bacteroides acidifaciens]|uniref:tyrosine-type recombinase/integrase n=1 Tax=Bacteroides acidifaciens TaxID=85831 RepID=UPI002592F4B5|nr:phage integrase SAM-like domain-containing protein [Bacteroides acidifaciens]
MIGQIFFNEVRASFNLRKPKSDRPTNIYLVCRINKKQVKLSTGVRVYPDQWNTKKQEAYVSPRLTELDNINNAIVNDEINKLKADFIDFKRYICDNPNEIDNSLFLLKKYIYKDRMMKQQELQKPVQWLRRAISQDKTIKSDGQRNTLAIYWGHLKVFEEFLKATDREDITFADINLALIKDYETYLFNRQIGKGKTTKTSTVGNKVTALISIIKRAEPYGLIDTSAAKLNQYKKPKSREGDDNEIYLSEEEVNKMYSLELKGLEEKARDVFVLQCWTGQRFSDMQLLNNGTIKDFDNGKILEIVQKKRTHKVSIPLFPVALEILEKYNFQIPKVRENTMLKYIKEAGKKAGIIGKHIVTEDRGSKITNTTYCRYELIGTHTGRRSFISNMLKRGYDSHILMRITGHTTEMAFKKYAKISSEDAANLMLETEATKVKQLDKVATTISQEGNKEAINILKQHQNIIDGITFDTLLDTQFFASRINKAVELQSQVGHLKNGKLCSYDNEINSLISEIEKFSQSSTSDSDVAKQYVKQLSVGKLSDLYDSFREMIIKCVKIGISKDAIMQFINKALEIGLLDNERFANIKEITTALLDKRNKG